jgi:hypothetical protein
VGWGDVDFDVGLGAAAVRALKGVESTALCCLTECGQRELVVRERLQRHKSCVSGNVGHHEAMQVVQDRPSDDLSESTVIAFIGTLERSQVGVALLLEDDDWRVSQAHQHQVQRKAPNSSIAVEWWTSRCQMSGQTASVSFGEGRSPNRSFSSMSAFSSQW